MSKRTSIVARRAWEILRALMGARMGELCRNRVALTLNNFHKLARKIIHSAGKSRRGALLYGDREFSFQNSPVVHVRMSRPAAAAMRFKLPQIPCLRPPQVDRDDWDEEDEKRTYFLKNGEEEEDGEMSEEGIDERAEEFIARFYENMKLQRRISYV